MSDGNVSFAAKKKNALAVDGLERRVGRMARKLEQLVLDGPQLLLRVSRVLRQLGALPREREKKELK